MRVRVAAVQLNSRDDKAANIAAAETLIGRAAEGGARLVVLPELWTYLGPEAGNAANAEPIPGPTTELLAALARQHQITLHGGSFLEAAPEAGDGRCYNTAVLLDAQGQLVVKYRKIHLFDADPLPGAAPYRESATVAPGSDVATATVDGLRLGLATCYDLRFPELFRALAQRGAEVLTLPAAFTLETGRDHWEVLVRARAIENGCFVIAPDQWGAHPPVRVKFGHSLIVDPWGTVLAQAPDGPGVIWADLDLERMAEVRHRLPSLANRRPETYA
jgi:deaminated glutathione amidase